MGIKGIIFDLDGTLLHTIEDIAASANELFRAHGVREHTTAYYLKWIGNGARRFIEQAVGEDVDRELLSLYLLEFREIYARRIHEKTRLYDGVPELLDRISALDMKIAVLSNKPHDLTLSACAHYLSDWPMDPVFGQREELPIKPDPAAAFEIAKMWGLKPQEILFVGDSDNDLLTAKAAGMPSLAVTWGYGRLTCQDPDEEVCLVANPSEVAEFVEAHQKLI